MENGKEKLDLSASLAQLNAEAAHEKGKKGINKQVEEERKVEKKRRKLEEEAKKREAALPQNQEDIAKGLQHVKGLLNRGLKEIVIYSFNLDKKDVNSLKRGGLLAKVEQPFPSVTSDSS